MQESIRQQRLLLKDSIRKAVDFAATDQNRFVPPPPAQKPCPTGAKTVPLTPPEKFGRFCRKELLIAMRDRRSIRHFSSTGLSLPELSFLLWATQGVTAAQGDTATFRTVPSAGARHALETYVGVSRVDGLAAGVYRYLPLDHQLVCEFTDVDIAPRLEDACFGQSFVGEAAAVFLWAAVPYRMEWRYGLAAHRVILLDAGHVCQNLYLACEAIDAGTCAVGAYDQDAVDTLLRLDGDDEFIIYCAPVGRK